jgi:hypothetical protein
MLRVFKPKSPMSVGVWTLVGFSGGAAAAAFAGFMRERYGPSLPLRVLENAGQAASLAFGLPFSNYTGVLIELQRFQCGTKMLAIYRCISALPG